MASGFWGGFVEGITEAIEKKREQSAEIDKSKYISDREQGLQILKAITEGNLKPAGTGEIPDVTMPEERVAPKNIGEALMQGFGLKRPEMKRGQGYTVQPNLQRQLQEENLNYIRNINKQMRGERKKEDLIYRDITQNEISPEIAQKDIAQGNTNYYISRKDISKSGMKETIVSKPEDLEKSKVIKEKSNFIINQAQDALDTITEVEKGINYFGSTGQFPSFHGTQRYVWETNIKKLLSGKMIELMTQMKEASKTGATGFGQLSEKEGQILKEASTALKRGLPPKKAQEYLNKMKLSLRKIIQGSQMQPTEDLEYQNYLKALGQ